MESSTWFFLDMSKDFDKVKQTITLYIQDKQDSYKLQEG